MKGPRGGVLPRLLPDLNNLSSATASRVPRRQITNQIVTRAAPLMRVETTVLQRFNFTILIAFLFMIFSRIFEMYFSWLHLPGISYRLVGIFLLMTGTFMVAFRDSIGKCVLAFTACFLIAIPFSIWRGGSVGAFTNGWLMSFTVFVATASLISDLPQYIRTVKTIALAILMLTIMSLALGTTENGRLFLERGRFSNPNEMAQALLLGMPFWWALYANSRSLFGKLLGAGSLALMLFVISKTGSRGALISLLVIVGFLFARASVVGKMKLLVSAGVLLALAILTLPGGLKARYQTFFSEEEHEASQPQTEDTAAATGMLGSAVASTNSRKDLLIRSLIVTLQHPLLGVGPGNFMVAENDMAKAEGKRKGAWLGTHNTFTQVSSECGIPAFLLYCGIVVLSLKKSYALYRRTRQHPQFREIGTHALALNYSLITFVITGMFVHAAYTALLPVLAGLTVSLARTAQPSLPQGPIRPPVKLAFVIRQRAHRASAPQFSPARFS